MASRKVNGSFSSASSSCFKESQMPFIYKLTMNVQCSVYWTIQLPIIILKLNFILWIVKFSKLPNTTMNQWATSCVWLWLLFDWIGSKTSPKSQCLICSCWDYCLSIWTHSHVEHSAGVSSQFGHFHHWWVFPNSQLVLCITMAGHQFFVFFWPKNGANLKSD